MINDNQPERKPDGTFQKGVSGNIKGRPKLENAALRAKFMSNAEELAEIVMQQALGGDMTAARIILDRILPPLKATTQSVAIDMPHCDSPAELATAILKATTAGKLSPDTASQLIGATSNLSRILETEELKHRIEAIERALNHNKRSS